MGLPVITSRNVVRRHRDPTAALHRHAPGFSATHHAALYTLDGSSPAAAWLNTGPVDPQLLATLDRTALLPALRPGTTGPVQHQAHALTADPAAVLAQVAGPAPDNVSWPLQVLAWRRAV